MVPIWFYFQLCICYLNPFLLGFVPVSIAGKREVALCNSQVPVLNYLKETSMPLLLDVSWWGFLYLFWHYCKLDIETHSLGFFMDTSIVLLAGILFLSQRDAQLKSVFHRVVFIFFVGIWGVGFFYFYMAPHFLTSDWLLLLNRVLFVAAGGPFLLFWLMYFPFSLKHSKTLDMTVFLIIVISCCVYISRCNLSPHQRTFTLLFGLINSTIPAASPFMLPYLCYFTFLSPKALFYCWCLLCTIFSLKLGLVRRNKYGQHLLQTRSKATQIYHAHELTKNHQSEHFFCCVKVIINCRCLATFLLLLFTILADENEIAHGVLLLAQLVWALVFYLRQLSRIYPDMDSKEAVLKQRDKEIIFVLEQHLRKCIRLLISKNLERGKLGIEETEYNRIVEESEFAFLKEMLPLIDSCTDRLAIVRVCYSGSSRRYTFQDFNVDVDDSIKGIRMFPKNCVPPLKMLKQCARLGISISESGAFGLAMGYSSVLEAV